MSMNVEYSRKNFLPIPTNVGDLLINTSGNNTLVAAPGAGFRLVVKALTAQNESSSATTVKILGGETLRERKVLQQYEAILMYLPAGEEWYLPENKALIVNLSGANNHNYSGLYMAVPV